MRKYYYYNKESMILRDHLAADRTVLANERTFLAYIRTALSILVAGASFIKFFEIPLINYIGYFFIPLGGYIGYIGIKRYLLIRERLLHVSFNEIDYK